MRMPKHKCGSYYIPLGILIKKISEKDSENTGRAYHCANCEIYVITGVPGKPRNREFTSHKELNNFIKEEGNLELISTKL